MRRLLWCYRVEQIFPLMFNLSIMATKKKSILKFTAYCASAVLTVVLPTGIIFDLESFLQQFVSKFR
ncbi:hypothetical protein BH10BAC3_BH10BAC3_14590 [soil metagenome]